MFVPSKMWIPPFLCVLQLELVIQPFVKSPLIDALFFSTIPASKPIIPFLKLSRAASWSLLPEFSWPSPSSPWQVPLRCSLSQGLRSSNLAASYLARLYSHRSVLHKARHQSTEFRGLQLDMHLPSGGENPSWLALGNSRVYRLPAGL